MVRGVVLHLPALLSTSVLLLCATDAYWLFTFIILFSPHSNPMAWALPWYHFMDEEMEAHEA